MTVNMNGLSTIIDTLQHNVVNGFKGISALDEHHDLARPRHISVPNWNTIVSAALQSLQDEVASMLTEYFRHSESGSREYKERRSFYLDGRGTADKIGNPQR